MRPTIVKTARLLDKYYNFFAINQKCIRSFRNSEVEVPDFDLGKHLLDGSFRYDHVSKLPRKVDWFRSKLATDVRDQGIYDTANIIAAVGAVESAYAIFKKRRIRLSVQEVINFNPWNCGVYGGSIASVFDYIAERRGLCRESDYPYRGLDREGPTSEFLRTGDIIGYETCENEDQFFQALAQQPLAAAIVSSQDFINHRGEGIFRKTFQSKKFDEHCSYLVHKFMLENGEDEEVLANLSNLEAVMRAALLKAWLTDAVLVVGYNFDGDDSYVEALCSRGKGHGARGLSKISFEAARSMGMMVGASFPVV